MGIMLAVRANIPIPTVSPRRSKIVAVSKSTVLLSVPVTVSSGGKTDSAYPICGLLHPSELNPLHTPGVQSESAVQGSPSSVQRLPSSHPSPASRTAFPHIAVVVQELEQPSP